MTQALDQLDLLASRVEELVQTVRMLRDENQALRMQIADREAENRALAVRLERARLHVENALAKMPAA